MPTEIISASAEDWALLCQFLPSDWRELARSTGALKGLRQDKSEDNLLRTLLLHVGCGYSLRESVVRAREGGLGDLSDVALLKRLRKSQAWLYELCRQMFGERKLDFPSSSSHPIRLIDATTVKEPGPTGSQWRVHYSLRLPSLRCDFFKVTPTRGKGTGENLRQIPVQRGDYLIADRGYSDLNGAHQVCLEGAHILVRLNQQAVHLERPGGQRFALLRQLRTLGKAGQIGEWEVEAVTDQGRLRGRVCAVRKSQAATARAQKRLRRRDRGAEKLLPETLEHAGYVTVFTTFPAGEFPAAVVLQWYRGRWQVELVFKRFKQIARLGHLPKYQDESAQAWLYGKLLVAMLTEKLIIQARAFSPWGYELEGPAPAQPRA